ncbi:precorrin-6A synthase (deacetylating) [Paragemmobacter straminiformis]|uniref:Precorrin-6A synthase [deacetylating] n=1 Tax=Paragemmobacter straminiformis TaxID=2045119 RepID=A0A842I3Y6_9RHOB|nr:precorrin-6A synthase (deacetylating) [Gemmobacter straminiformis]MBC2834301.1 precorrin-6A synthase (deacetylating) [Gemmobacter straminiformis]
MEELFLIGIGTGNPDHLTLQAIKAMRQADLILIPKKGPDKSDLAGLRHAMLAEHAPRVAVAEFDMPKRDVSTGYLAGVEAWHDAIATEWVAAIARAGAGREFSQKIRRVALLVWGDPSLYDSTLRIAARLAPQPKVTVIPAVTSVQVLTAGHAIPVNEVGAPFTVTTGRQLRDHGWPEGIGTLVVMLDGECSFLTLPPAGVHIWWGAYVGMAEEVLAQGPLAEMAATIPPLRERLRAEHGWIMDIYVLRRKG